MRLRFYKSDFSKKVFDKIPIRHGEYLNFTVGMLSDHLENFEPEIGASTIEIPSLPSLSVEEAIPALDSKCARDLHYSLRELPRNVARDRRLWLCLAHEQYSEYLYKRWDLNNGKSINVLKERIGLIGGLAGLAGHGLARLWWAAELSLDDSNEDDNYWLLDTAFCNQDIHQKLFESQVCINQKLLRNLLKTLKNYFETTAEEQVSKTKVGIAIAKELNSWAKVDLVETLNEKETEDFVNRIINNIKPQN